MTATVADVLRAVSPQVTATLVTPPAWERLVACAEALPLSSGGGLECYLDQPGRADLAVRYTATELQRLAAMPGMPPGLAGLADYWQPHGRPSAGMRMVWLEFDVQADRAPVLSVFAGPGYPPGGKPPEIPNLAEWAEVMKASWPAASSDAADRVAWLQQTLPPEAWIGYIGVMRGNALRATVSGIAPYDVVPLLRQLDWPGDTVTLSGVLDLAYRTGARLTLGLGLTGGIGSRLGIELGLLGADGWPGLLDAAAGLLPLTKFDVGALLGWAGESVEAPGWPDPGIDIRIIRRINHLKFGFAGDPHPQVKAYLYYGLVSL